ncbi:hypothetical protein ACIRN5_23300, partial [Lysinibacillus fusiformis]|uniref:hypothetical protein n=2 Tax=Bacillati TaxID=1783272 RepID=UPI0037FF4B6D
MPLHFTTGPDAQRGGLDITFNLPYKEALTVGPADADELANLLHTALWGLSVLRTGKDHRLDESEDQVQPITADDWPGLISHLETARTTLLTGITAAAIRAHHTSGGSIGHLARAMDTARSTAQARQDKVLKHPAGDWETWAAQPAEPHPDIRDGWSYTIDLHPEEAKHVGFEAQQFADWMDTALWGL